MIYDDRNRYNSHEALTSQITQETYVAQDTPRGCGVAAVLMARNVLIGKRYPLNVTQAIVLMAKQGYPVEKGGRTSVKDRDTLVLQLNELTDQKIKHSVYSMPLEQDAYARQLEQLLTQGNIALVGFKPPYFNLPEGAQDETRDGVFHGAVVHGLRYVNSELVFIVTDPDSEVTQHIGMNIEVEAKRFYNCLSDYSKSNVETVSTT